MKNKLIILLSIIAFFQTANAQNIQIDVDVLANRKPVSPYLYGRNNSLSSNLLTNDPNTVVNWQYLKEAGVTIFRDNGGNNSTKYNWRRKISSHPDWYNNVYANNWMQQPKLCSKISLPRKRFGLFN